MKADTIAFVLFLLPGLLALPAILWGRAAPKAVGILYVVLTIPAWILLAFVIFWFWGGDGTINLVATPLYGVPAGIATLRLIFPLSRKTSTLSERLGWWNAGLYGAVAVTVAAVWLTHWLLGSDMRIE